MLKTPTLKLLTTSNNFEKFTGLKAVAKWSKQKAEDVEKDIERAEEKH